jgi:hypothetical protein
MAIGDYKKPKLIRKLVERSIRQVPAAHVKGFTDKVIR